MITRFFVLLIFVLVILCVVLFAMWRMADDGCKRIKKEYETASVLLESYRRMQEVQTKEKIEIEKDLQASVGTGSSDSFNASIDLMQKLNDKGKSRS